MKYMKTATLRDGRECVIRNADRQDAEQVLAVFRLTHGETENLTSYPDEITMTSEQEAEYLAKKTESEKETELIAVVDGKVAGTAGIDSVGRFEKVRHRAEFGIGILREYWRLGIGRALTEACIECAKRAGYAQLELAVVSDNENAISLYKSVGFVEYGRNPDAFRSRTRGVQENVLMRLVLSDK